MEISVRYRGYTSIALALCVGLFVNVQSAFAQVKNDELSELALISILLGDESAFSDSAFAVGESDVKLVVEPITIFGAENPRQGSYMSCYSGHLVGDELWFVTNSTNLITGEEYGTWDLWTAPAWDLETMVFGKPSTDYFDSLGVNTPLNEGFFSLYNSMLVYTGCEYRDGYGSCDIILRDLRNPTKEVFFLSRFVNTTVWEAQPTIDDDATIFLISNEGPLSKEGITQSEQICLFASTFDASSKQYLGRKRLPKFINHSTECTGPYVVPGTHTLIYCAAEKDSTTGSFWCTQYTRDEQGRLNFSAPKRLPASLSGKGRPVSFSYDRVSRTIIIGLMINGRYTLNYVRLPESM
jgi:hypothetical protein